MTYYLPSESGWQSAGASTAYFLRLKVERSYDVAANRSTFLVSLQAKGVNNVYGGTYNVQSGGTLSGGGNTLYTFVTTDANRMHKVAIDSVGTWNDVTSVYNPSNWSFTADHADDGSLTVSFGVNIRLYGYINGGAHYGDFFNRTTSLTVNEARASTIASISNAVETLSTFSVTMNRASTSFYHLATFSIGANTLYTSGAFASSLSFTVPQSWFNSYPDYATLYVTASIQTYTDSGVAVGSDVTQTITVTADATMKPTLQIGFASVTPVGTPAGFSGYIQGISKAQVSLSSALVTYVANAYLSYYTVTCQGYTGTGTGTAFLTNVLTGTAAITITVTVTDSRGRSASTTLTVTPMAYALPTISSVTVFRCNSGGTADDDEKYIFVKATAGCSSLGGNNSVELRVQYRAAGGAWSTAEQIDETGTNASVIGNNAIDPDSSYEVLFTAVDGINSVSTTTVTLPTRQWAMKFRPDGQGVAFGKAPSRNGVLEIPGDWAYGLGSFYYGFSHEGNNGLHLYFSDGGDPADLYSIGFYPSGLSLDRSTDGGITWANVWVYIPTP